MSNTRLCNGRLTNLNDVPLEDRDAVNQNYVDGQSQKSSVKVATISDISLTSVTEIDDISLNENDRVLIKDQSDSSENGIYYLDASDNLIRSNGAQATDIAAGCSVFVTDGTVNDNTIWQCIDTYGTLFGTNTEFQQVGTNNKNSLTLKDPESVNTVTLTAPTLTSDIILTLPDNGGGVGEILTTDGAGVLSWLAPSGSTSTTLLLEDPGAAATAITIHAKVGTAAFSLIFPGTVGTAGQVLSTGTTAGTMEWVDKISPGGALPGTSLILEDPGAAVTAVTLNAKIGTAAYTLILPGTTGTPNQVLSTGSTPGTMAWIDNHLPPGGALTQLQYHKTGGVFGGSASLTWDETTLNVAGPVATRSLLLEDTGAAITKVTLNAKAGTTAYTLVFPGTVGTVNQVLSTGSTVGIMEWVSILSPGGALPGTSLILEDPGAPITAVTLSAKTGTAAFTLTLPGAVGAPNQVLSTGSTPGTMEWVNNFTNPGGALSQLQYYKTGGVFGGSASLTWDETTLTVAGPVSAKSLLLEDTGASSTKIILNAKEGTAAYTLIFPGTVGTAGQVLSTGSTAGTAEWVTKLSPGGALPGTSLVLEDPGAPVTTVTISAKTGTAAYALILPGTTGAPNQVLSTGSTAGTMEWVDNHLPPGGALTQLQYYKTGGVFGGSASLTWDETTLNVAGPVATRSLLLEDTGAAITKVTLNAKVGTNAFTLVLPGTIGTAGQVLSTGSTAGTMEWISVLKSGDALAGTSLSLEDPGAPITPVTISAKVGTAAFTLILPGTTGTAGQVLSTGSTAGTMEWVDNHLPPGGALTQLQYYKTGGVFGGSASLTWDETTLNILGSMSTRSLLLEDPGAAITKVVVNAKIGTAAYTLILPGSIGTTGQVLSTGSTPGTMEWVSKVSPGGAVSGTSLILEDPGAAITTVSLSAKEGTAAYALSLPGTIGAPDQVLSTGSTPGTMEWVTKLSPGGALPGTSLVLEDPGAAVTTVTLSSKVGTAAYALILPGTTGAPNQVLSTGSTAGTMEWVDNHLPPGGALTQLQYHKTGGVFGGSASLTWDETTLNILGSVSTRSLLLEDPGAAITKVTINAKESTTAYALILPGSIGGIGQVLSTGSTPGTMEWVTKVSPGGPLEGTSLILEDPGAAITKVTISSKVGTAAYALILPGAVGTAKQVLSTGTTPGTMEWISVLKSGDALSGISLILEDPGAPITPVTISAKAGTAAFTLILPGTTGTAGQVLSTGTTAGTMEWVDNHLPPGGALTQLQYHKTGGVFGGSSNLTWDETTLNIAGSVSTRSLLLEDPGAAITKVTLNAKIGTAAFTLILPGSIGAPNQVLSTGSTPGIMEWVTKVSPGGPLEGTSLILEDPGAAVTTVTLSAKTGTAAYALILPGTTGAPNQVLSTGATAGTMEWVTVLKPGDALAGTSLVLEDPGAPITPVTISAKTGTAAFTLILPGTIGTANQVLSTGSTAGTMEWVDNHLPPGGALTQLQYHKTGGVFGGSSNLTWDETTLRVTGTVDTKTLKLEDTGAAITKVTINAKEGTAAYALILPGSTGTAGQVLSTGAIAGTMEWVDNHLPPGGAITQLQYFKTGGVFGGSSSLTWDETTLRVTGTVDTNTLKLEDTGAAITKVAINAKAGTTAYALILPGVVGTAGQVLSTGSTPGTMEWVTKVSPGGSIEGTSLILEDPGAAITTVNISAKVGTAAYSLVLPGAIGATGQVLSTGTTVGTMEWVTVLKPGDALAGTSLVLEDPGAPITPVTINAKVGTAAYTLVLPGSIGTANQVLSTGSTAGTMEWVDNHLPPGGALTQLQYHKTGGVFGGSSNLTWDETTLRVTGTVDTKTLKLEDTGAAITKISLNAKAGTTAYALIFPGTVGTTGQVLSTGTVAGTMEWVNKVSPGGALDGTSLLLEDPGAAITKVTINAKVGTAAYALNLPGTIGLANQVLSTGSTVGTMEWVNRSIPGAAVETTSIIFEDPGAAITKVTLTAKVGTAAYTLILPGAVGGANQVLSTGTTPGTMAWVDNHLPPGGALTQLQYHKTGGVFGGSSNLTWDETTLRVSGNIDANSLKLEDTGAAITKVTISAKVGTTAYALVLPGTVGTVGQVLSTGSTAGTMEWVNRSIPGGALDGTSVILEDPGAAVTKVTLTAKVGTAAYALILPGTVGAVGQVLSTGTTAGTMEWVNKVSPGGAIDCTSVILEDPGAAVTKVTLSAKVGTAAYALILPGTVGTAGQVLSTGTTAGTAEWVTKISAGGPVDCTSVIFEDPGAAITKVTMKAKVGTAAYAVILPGTVGTAGQVLSTGTTPGTAEWVTRSPLDRSTLQSCFDNPMGSGTVITYSIWGHGSGGNMDYTMLGYSGTIVKLTCSYSGTSAISIAAAESLSFSVGYVNLIQTVFAPFTGGLNVISWTTANTATYPSTSSTALNIPFTAINRIALRAVETGTVGPTSNVKINCVLTVQLNEV
jgi:hypothetical protein